MTEELNTPTPQPQAPILTQPADTDDKLQHLIKVIGVGGAGGNAVKNMYQRGVTNVDFVVCNTDRAALLNNPVPNKIEIGIVGAGGIAAVGREEAEAHIDKIESMLEGDAEMVFIAAGMGGGTGTGAAPVIARKARERGLLTVAVVTLPFLFEKGVRIKQALLGIEQLKKEVDAMIIVNNQRLLDIYSQANISVEEAFSNADNTLFSATKSIAEIITVQGIINMDFRDVNTVLKDSGSALMATGLGEGENRIQKAIKNALDSPLLNSLDIRKAKRMLYIIYTCKDSPVTAAELSINSDFMEELQEDIEVLFGLYRDDTLGNQVKVTIVATGYDNTDAPIPEENPNTILEKAKYKELRSKYYDPQVPTQEPEPEAPLADNTPEPEDTTTPLPAAETTPSTDEADTTPTEAPTPIATTTQSDINNTPSPNDDAPSATPASSPSPASSPRSTDTGGNIFIAPTTPRADRKPSKKTSQSSWFEKFLTKLSDWLEESK